MEERNSKYDLLSSRNGLTVPVINGVYLHSIYNPTREATTFAQSNEKTLKLKSRIIVLGLGFGYHIEEIARVMNKYHSQYEIIVIEPNKRLVSDFMETRNFEDKRIKIICKDRASRLFNNWGFVNFLMKKPAIIKHDASFVLEKDFFSEFLGYKAPKEITNYRSILTDSAQDLVEGQTNQCLLETMDVIEKRMTINSKQEYALMALKQIINNSQGMRS